MKPSLRALLVCALVVSPLPARARAQADLPYPLADAFSTALRFVRIDRSCKVVDKDSEAAFIAFEYSDDGKVKRGSLELFKVGAPRAGAVRAQLTLGDDTHATELRWLELYERKLREERGTPPPPSPPASKPLDGGV
jgi:hypothetical protein